MSSTTRLLNAVRGLCSLRRVRRGRAFRRGRHVRVIDGELTLGNRVTILRNAEIQGRVRIGDFTFINRDAYIRDRTSIGNAVSIGPFVRLISDSHALGSSRRRAGEEKVNPITIEDGVWIGASVTVLGGVTIGKGAVVAAGSVVTRDVAADTLVAGVPARLVRELSRE